MYRPSNVLATITFVLFCSASTLVRVSFLVFYRRLIQHLHWRLYIRVIHATILFAIGLYIAYILGLVFRCRFVLFESKVLVRLVVSVYLLTGGNFDPTVHSKPPTTSTLRHSALPIHTTVRAARYLSSAEVR